MNEVRLSAAGITANGGILPADATIRWRPEASISGLRPGGRITQGRGRAISAWVTGLDWHGTPPSDL